MSARATTRVAYVIAQFPEMHETFILREIVELRRRGLDLAIFSLLPCRDVIVHPEARRLKDETVYSAFVLSRPLLLAQAHFLRRRPLRYLSTLGYVALRSLRSPRLLVRAVEVFPKAVYFARLMRDGGVRHVHAHWATTPTVAAVIVSRLTGIPYSFSAHAFDIFVDRTMLDEKIRDAAFVVTCSRFARDHLASTCNGATTSKVLVNYHGVDPVEPAPVVSRSATVPAAILSVGRLAEQKGYPYLIEACRLLREAGLTFRCTIVGDGPERSRLRGQIDAAGLNDLVELAGARTFREVARLYETASFFVLPCVVTASGDRDGIPNVLLEAMARGLAVISTRISGIPEAVTSGETGLLVAERDARALADAMAFLLDRPAERERLGRQARARIRQDFDLRRNVQALYDLFTRQTVLAR